MLNIKELNAKSPAALRLELENIQRALLGVRIEVSNQAVNKSQIIKKLRKQVAQVKTIMRAKQIAGEKEVPEKVEQVEKVDKVEDVKEDS